MLIAEVYMVMVIREDGINNWFDYEDDNNLHYSTFSLLALDY